MTADEPLKLVLLHGITAEQLRAALARCPQYQGAPILTAGASEVRIVEFRPERTEMDIEDEP